MNIPFNLKNILERDQALQAEVLSIVSAFEPIIKDRLFFFEEYTDHGIEHIEKVLKAAEFLIPEESFQWMKPQEIAIIILSVLLHDIGMHTEFTTFKAMLDGEYDNVKVDIVDDKTWSELWEDYLSEVKHFSSNQKEKIWGSPDQEFNIPNLSNIDSLNGVDKKLIGEFLRRFHARLAHEIALKGFIGNKNNLAFGTNSPALPEFYKQLAGITARSHGINVRDTFEYLQDIAYDSWKNPNDINIIFLMVLLRIADYIQIDNTRTDPRLLKLKTFSSQTSIQEHETHLAITGLNFKNDDPELIVVNCNPKNAQMYVKLDKLINDIQYELDLSWAILGEVYGKLDESPLIKFRRIKSNLKHPKFLNKIDYVPKQVSFNVNSELSKLLVAPLYGNDPKYGIRELVQNATDACKERIKIQQDLNNEYEPFVIVSIDSFKDDKFIFKIKDNGKGMTLDEILNYFLNVGSSFRKSYNWKKEFISEDGHVLVNRNGRFGIGVLAAFLLGDQIEVKTKSHKDEYVYSFSTQIDSEFVNISRVDDSEDNNIGTEISIFLSKEKYNQIIEKKQKKDWEKIIYWTDWYNETLPKVTYTLDGKDIEMNTWYDPDEERLVNHPNYNQIKWCYKNKKDNRYRNMFVACNGIIVTLNSAQSSFSYTQEKQDDKDYFLLSHKPNLDIEDPKGVLSLKLDRNDLDSNNLDFDENLLTDIGKSFIAQLLTLPVKSDTIENIKAFPHFPSFLYSKQGYTILSDYTLTHLSEKFKLLKIITSDKKTVSNLIWKYTDDCIILPSFDNHIGLSYQTENVAPKVGGTILLYKEKYNELFKTNIRRIQVWAKNAHKILWMNEDFVCYSIYDHKSKTNIINEDICQKIFADDKYIQSVQEIPFQYINSQRYKCGQIISNLFEEYLGDNIIIPYDIEERKKVYFKAFEDLGDYMKDYASKDLDDDEIEEEYY